MDQGIKTSDNASSFFSNLIWQFKGFINSCWDTKFYQKATQKRVIIAVVFLFIFAFTQTIVNTVKVRFTMIDSLGEIKEAFQNRTLPAITIKDGEAIVSPNLRYQYLEDGTIIAIDTSDYNQNIDRTQYFQGLLLTKKTIQLLQNGQLQTFDLMEVNNVWKNPIILDENTISSIWKNLSFFVIIFSSIATFIWNSMVKLASLSFVGLFVWGIASIKYQNIGFEKILITGIYANVPAVYLTWLLSLVKIGFLGLYSILLVSIWGFFLLKVLIEISSTMQKSEEFIQG